MFTDSHCHLASHRYEDKEISELLERAQAAGIHRMITLSTGADDVQDNIRLAENYAEIYCTVGIHPCDVVENTEDIISQLRGMVENPRVVALGETGLDYYHPAPEGWSEEDYHARQRDFLEKHFQLAAECGLNIVLHTRDRSGEASFKDCLEIYARYAEKVQAVFHCFPGDLSQAEQVLELGGMLSFTGNVTFKNATQIQETVTALPLGSFMLETDAPYLAPVPYRGQRNEPAYVKEIASHICTLKKISPSELASATEQAVERFFRFL